MCASVCQVPCSCPESRSTTVMPKGYRRVQCAKSNSQFNTSSMHFALSAQFNHTRQVDGVSLSVLETSHIRARLTEKLQLLGIELMYINLFFLSHFLQVSQMKVIKVAGRLVELLDIREVDAQHPEPALVELSLPPANDLLHICWLH